MDWVAHPGLRSSLETAGALAARKPVVWNTATVVHDGRPLNRTTQEPIEKEGDIDWFSFFFFFLNILGYCVCIVPRVFAK